MKVLVGRVGGGEGIGGTGEEGVEVGERGVWEGGVGFGGSLEELVEVGEVDGEFDGEMGEEDSK